MTDSSPWVTVLIHNLGLRLDCPPHWHHRAEGERTYLLWDEYTGSLRLSATPVEGDPQAAVEAHALRLAGARSPQRRTLGSSEFSCWQEDDGDTRSHFYVRAIGQVLVVCSWAYGVSLLAGEESAAELESETERAEAVLASLTLGADG